MKTKWTPFTLATFERFVADSFNRGEIKSPVHLAGGNEENLIEIFQEINEKDWVCGTWRSHYHCLLKGVPADELMAAIVDGRSIALCFPKYRVICSAMVGGIMPIALGLAWAAKRRGLDEKVWCFIGDMAATTGIAAECSLYIYGQDLPLKVVVEDNGKSVATNTVEAWGGLPSDIADYRYSYELPHQHVGIGKWVSL